MNQPVDLTVLGAELLANIDQNDHGGRAARSVLHEPGLRVTVIALRAGQELAEHAAPAAATLHVHSGRVQLRAEATTQVLAAGQLTVIPHERHSLVADTDAVVLLTVRVRIV
jgi:quercetin dioxygenase-like cupin family protein